MSDLEEPLVEGDAIVVGKLPERPAAARTAAITT